MQLYLQTPGTYLHVRDAMFEVRVRTQEGVQKTPIAAHQVSAILMQKGTALSTDAIALALKHHIDLMVVEWDGQPIGRFWHSKLGSTTKIRKLQLQASLDQRGLFWVKSWLGERLAQELFLLQRLKKHRPHLVSVLDEKRGMIAELQAKIKQLDGESVELHAASLRGWEGTAGRIYFEGLSACLPEKWQFKGRSRRPAHDAFNALLNYAYGMLYGWTEKTLILAGLDPFVGFLHRDDYNHKSLVYDFIEPFRVHAERVVMRLLSGKKVNQEHFEQVPKGIGLSKEGKKMLVESFNDFMKVQKTHHRNRRISRLQIMQWEAHRLANALLGGQEPFSPEQKLEQLSL